MGTTHLTGPSGGVVKLALAPTKALDRCRGICVKIVTRPCLLTVTRARPAAAPPTLFAAVPHLQHGCALGTATPLTQHMLRAAVTAGSRARAHALPPGSQQQSRGDEEEKDEGKREGKERKEEGGEGERKEEEREEGSGKEDEGGGKGEEEEEEDWIYRCSHGVADVMVPLQQPLNTVQVLLPSTGEAHRQSSWWLWQSRHMRLDTQTSSLHPYQRC
ncbi:hypothetical protein V8C86DRAFT_1622257 [Haematococcus lacustris]